MTLYIGLMSGTSMDGVDAALVDLDTNQCILGLTRPYHPDVKQHLKQVIDASSIHIGALSQLNTILGREFGAAVLELLEKAQCPAHDIVAIGSHGQTLCHDSAASPPYTVQVACPHTIAEMTGIQVVADFRTRDLIVGGQGAPFAPLYHQVLFGQQQGSLAVVNIGGIANVTFLEPEGFPRGYDTGPGNCLMDAWIDEHLKKPYDANGEWARSGQVIPSLLQACLADPYFQQLPPKSLGKEYFSRTWLSSKLRAHYANEDIQATLLELTACTIQLAISQHTHLLERVVICGGGVHNRALMDALQQHMKNCSVVSSAHFGIHPDFIEAMMFAWLAEKTVHGISHDLSRLTGAAKPVILGAIYPA